MLSRLLKKIKYKFYTSPLGGGKPVPVSIWQEQYENGVWASLDEISEMAHYIIIVGYLLHLKKSSDKMLSILDAGCGHGVLCKYIMSTGNYCYTGIDISANAITKATENFGNESNQFIAADIDEWESETKYDIIIFNESLYYVESPVDTVAKYCRMLKKDGSLIVSMCEYANHRVIFNKLLKKVELVDNNYVRNLKGQEWNVYLFKAK